jgi:CubicO group peptidase (beta-lactamase class C family)
MSDGQPQMEGYLDGLARLGGAVSAVEGLVADRKGVLFRHAAGFRVGGERLRPGARFDAASLTKPWIATLALVLDEKQLLGLSSPLREIFPEAASGIGETSLEDLLRHRSGIAAWTPVALRLGRELGDRTALAELLLAESLWTSRGESAGREARYSDLDYMLWGAAAERATGKSLSDLLDPYVAEPLGLPPIGALAAAPPQEEVVECRLDNGREVELAADQGLKLSRQAPFLRGLPQDGNARALGFLTGHAGLFLTADDCLGLAREWLEPARLLTSAAVERALSGGGAYGLAWARQTADGSSGPELSRDAFGHTGFTGGSIWVDPRQERIFVLLAHRLASRHDFNPVRREFHRLAVRL